MKVSFLPVGNHDDSDPQRARRVPSPAQGACRDGRDVDVRLRPARSRQGPGEADTSGSARQDTSATRSPLPDVSDRADAGRAGQPLIVLDASALLELVLHTSVGQAVGARIADPGTGLHVPHLADLEVVQAMRRSLREKEMDAASAAAALK